MPSSASFCVQGIWVLRRAQYKEISFIRCQMWGFWWEKCCCCLVAKSCLTFLQPHGLYPTGSSVHGISQARILSWVAVFFSRGSSRSRDQTRISCIDKQILYHWATRGAQRGIYNQIELWPRSQSSGKGIRQNDVWKENCLQQTQV